MKSYDVLPSEPAEKEPQLQYYVLARSRLRCVRASALGIAHVVRREKDYGETYVGVVVELLDDGPTTVGLLVQN
jgi:hypothetical protein